MQANGGGVQIIGLALLRCKPEHYQVLGHSVQGRPLVVREFGEITAQNVTLIFTMVHSDEITPLYVGWMILDWLARNIHLYPNTRVVVAPLVNPDGFFVKPRTRVNAQGVDVNRNFPTQDWTKKALDSWKNNFRSNPKAFSRLES